MSEAPKNLLRRSIPALAAIVAAGAFALPAMAQQVPSQQQPGVPGATTYPAPTSPGVSSQPGPLGTQTPPTTPKGSVAADRDAAKEAVRGVPSTPR